MQIFVIATLFLSLIVNYFLLKYWQKLGTQERRKDNLVRWAAQSKPAIGGIGFFAAFVVCIIYVGINGASDWWGVPTPTLAQHTPDYAATIPYFILCCTVGFLVGLLDDSFVMPPRFKFMGQLLCAAIMTWGGISVALTENAIFNSIFTAIWVVGMMNSVNMLDNMDGITAVVSLFILVNILLIAGFLSYIYVVFLVSMISALLGFLYYNWPPSRIFMGDSGSQLLGIFLAFSSVLFVWNAPYVFNNILDKMVLPAIIFMLPVMDTTTVTIRRLWRGQSPAVGGRDHLTHHLAYCGLKDRQVAQVFAALSLLTVPAVAYFLSLMEAANWTLLHTLCVMVLLAIIFGIFQYFYHKGKERQAARLAQK